MRPAYWPVLLSLGIPAFAQPQVKVLGATPTQVALSISGYSGSCSIAVSESPALSPLHPDVNGAEYPGANIDTGRTDTITQSNGTRLVTIGHMNDDRALAAFTTYYWQISGCGGTVSGSFSTSTLGNGSTQQWPVPFNSDNPWNFGYPQVNLLNPSPVVDPVTGVAVLPINTAADWGWRQGGSPSGLTSSYTAFSYWAGGSGWSNPQNVLNQSGSNASTSNTNSIDLYSPGCCADPADPWSGISIDDLGIIPWASASNSSGANAQFTACIFTSPSAGCLGTPITLTATGTFGQLLSGSSDPDQPFPASFPQAYFSGWGLTAPLGPDHVNTQGTLSCASGVCTVDTLARYEYFPNTMAVGQKIYIAGSSPACTNNLCTMASYQSQNQITTSESVTVSTGTQFYVLMWGVRIAKVTSTGSLTVGLAFKQAGARGLENPGAGGWGCSPESFVSGDGHTGFLCQYSSTDFAGIYYLYFISGDGTVRRIWTERVPSDASCFAPAGTNNQPGGQQFGAGGVVFSPTNAKVFYIARENVAGSNSIFQVTYTGDAYSNVVPNNYTFSMDGNAPLYFSPCDLTSWVNLTPGTSGYDLNTQISNYALATATGSANGSSTSLSVSGVSGMIAIGDTVSGTGINSGTVVTAYSGTTVTLSTATSGAVNGTVTFGYNSALYGSSFAFAGISGTTAFFSNNYSGQNNPAWLAVVDLSTSPALLKNMINTLDGTGSTSATTAIGPAAIRWGGHHNGTPTQPPNTIQLSEDQVGANNSSLLLSGPFEATPIGLLEADGVTWNSSTCLPWPVGAGGICSATVASGGSGYSVNSQFTVTGGSSTATGCVTSVGAGGVVTGVAFSEGACGINASIGLGYTTANGVTTSGSGSGTLTLNITAVSLAYDTTCPSGNPYAPWSFATAAGGSSVTNNCVTLRFPVGGVCNVAPSAAEIAAFPACPWNGSYTQPVPLAIGDNFTDLVLNGGLGDTGDTEHFRIVRITTESSPAYVDVVAMRNVIYDYCAAPNTYFPGTDVTNGVDVVDQFQHLNGWTLVMNPARLNGCTGAVYFYSYSAGGSTIEEEGRLQQGHGQLAPGISSGNYSLVSSNAVKTNVPFSSMFSLPTTFFSMTSPTFQNNVLGIGGGAVQSYTTTPGGVPWMTDSNAMNGNFGLGPEYPNNSIGPVTLTNASGNVYQITALGNDGFTLSNANYKLWPLVGWAGRYLLQDVSGPSSNIASAPWGICYAYHAGECLSGSAQGALYVNVPGAYKSGACNTGQSFLLTPCVVIGFPSGGGFRLQDITQPDTNSQGSVLVTYGLTAPGEHYPYTEGTALPDGSALLLSGHETQGWGAVSFLVGIPPFQQPAATAGLRQNSANRTQIQGIQAVVPPGFPYAEIQFGYSRFIGANTAPAGNFFCTARADGCNTSGSPYNFESETRTLTACSAGCSINIPVMAPNLVYYRVRQSSDGVNWTAGDVEILTVP